LILILTKKSGGKPQVNKAICDEGHFYSSQCLYSDCAPISIKPLKVSDPSQKYKIGIALVYGTAIIVLLTLIYLK